MVRGGFFSHARGASRARLAEILLNLLAAKPFRGEYLSLKMGCNSLHHVFTMWMWLNMQASTGRNSCHGEEHTGRLAFIVDTTFYDHEMHEGCWPAWPAECVAMCDMCVGPMMSCDENGIPMDTHGYPWYPLQVLFRFQKISKSNRLNRPSARSMSCWPYDSPSLWCAPAPQLGCVQAPWPIRPAACSESKSVATADRTPQTVAWVVFRWKCQVPRIQKPSKTIGSGRSKWEISLISLGYIWIYLNDNLGSTILGTPRRTSLQNCY